MDPTLQVPTCPICGGSNPAPLGPEETPCGDCLQNSTTSETQRREIGARLRAQYGEAAELVSRTKSYANLDWIIGGRRNSNRDSIALDREMAQLALLWLQDLARELDGELPPPPACDSEVSPASALRREAASRLRIATREFADTLRSLQLGLAESS